MGVLIGALVPLAAESSCGSTSVTSGARALPAQSLSAGELGGAAAATSDRRDLPGVAPLMLLPAAGHSSMCMNELACRQALKERLSDASLFDHGISDCQIS
jgi:hypothetical protein